MRVAIWIIVGVLVVGAVIFTVVSRSNAPKASGVPTADVIKRDAERFAKQADELTADVQQLQAKLAAKMTPDTKKKLDDLVAKAAGIKTEATRLQGLGGDEARVAKERLTELNKEARKLKRELDKQVK